MLVKFSLIHHTFTTWQSHAITTLHPLLKSNNINKNNSRFFATCLTNHDPVVPTSTTTQKKTPSAFQWRHRNLPLLRWSWQPLDQISEASPNVVQRGVIYDTGEDGSEILARKPPEIHRKPRTTTVKKKNISTR